MDKWRNSKPRASQTISDIFEDTLLPPTLRVPPANVTSAAAPRIVDNKKSKKWSIDGIFKKRANAKLLGGLHSSSSSLDELTTERRRRRRSNKGKASSDSKSNSATVAAGTTGYAAIPNIDGDAVLYRTIGNNNNNNEEEEENDEERYDNNITKLDNNYLNITAAPTAMSHLQTFDIMDQIRLTAATVASNNSRSCSDNGSSLDFNNPNRRVRKDKVKARVEAKRDQLCHGDSSMEDSSNNEDGHVSKNGSGKVMFSSESGSGNNSNSNGKRRSRSSRTERYMKRMCNGTTTTTTTTNGANGVVNGRSGSGFVNIAHYHSDLKDVRDRCKIADKDRFIRPIERVPRNMEYGGVMQQQQTGIGNGEMYTRPYIDNDVPTVNDNFYTRQADVGVNPLVQQTLQYFSEFDRNMAMQQQQQHKLPVTRNNKVYPNHHRHSHNQSQHYNNHHNHHHHHHQRRNSNHQKSNSYAENDDIILQQQPNLKLNQPLQQLEIDEERLSSVTPPKPPSRDHRSRILMNGTSLQKYQQMLNHMQRNQPDYTNKENQNIGYYASVNPRPNAYSPNTELKNVNDNDGLGTNSPDSMRSTMMMAAEATHKNNDDYLPQNRSFTSSQINRRAITSPLRESLNTSVIRDRGGSSISSPTTNPSSHNSHHSPDAYKSKIIDSPSPQRLNPTINNLKYKDYENSNYDSGNKLTDATTPTIDRMSERRSSKNLEEALCELEAIYNSLQLGDEELLDRAEKRTMEEFLYKGFTASPDCLDGCSDSMAMRRKTWADSALATYKDEPDRLRDDMAYRRLHAKNRPSSVDGQSSLSSISYLMTSPVPTRRDDMDYIDPRRKPRRKEPDVTLDDVVYRSIQYANNTLKVVEPQPPFGIPLGPITAATESDYLHTDPSISDRARSPYIPSKEPDIVTDDLAFRNLRKDAQPSSISSRQASPSFHTPMSSTPSPLPFNLMKIKKQQQRAVKSLSANLYGMINRSPRSPMQDLDNDDMFSITTDSTLDDYLNEVPSTKLNSNRRVSDPEVQLSDNWQRSNWQRLDVNSNRSKDRVRVTDLDLSNRSDDESYDERSPRTDVLRITDVDLNHKAGSDKGISSGVSSSCDNHTPPPSFPPCTIEPVTEQDLSVYKKLCQDLENLVQMTKGIDDVPIKSEPIVVKSHSPIVKETKSISKPILLEHTSSSAVTSAPIISNSISLKNDNGSEVAKLIETTNNEVTSEKQKPKKVQSKPTMDIGTSTINREISNLLDSLKCLGEESNFTLSSCLEENNEVSKDVVDAAIVEDNVKKERKVVTKETKCDLASSAAVDKSETLPLKKKESEQLKQKVEKLVEPEKSKEEDEEEERKDKVDENIFFRNAQLAKMSGDWKESTPKSAVINRRTSLITSTSNDNNNVGSSSSSHQHPWEGMNKCNHKYNSMPAKTSSLTLFRQYGSKKKSNRKSLCTIS